jgi:hypothetical protein
MWQCGKCREKVEDNFDACWNCGTSKEGVEDPGFQREGTGDVTAIRTGMGGDRAVTAPSEVAPPAVAQDSAGTDHLLARGLMWGLRGLALVAAIWGLINIGNAMEASRVAREASKQFRAFPGDPEQVPKAEQVAKAAERAGTTAVFTAVIIAVALVAVLLALAEGLRLCILIEGNTRTAGQPQAREKGKRRLK